MRLSSMAAVPFDHDTAGGATITLLVDCPRSPALLERFN